MVPTFSCRFPRRLFCQCSILLCLPRLGLWRKRSSSLAALWENRAELEVEEEDRESLRGPLKETTLTLWRWLCVRSQKKKLVQGGLLKDVSQTVTSMWRTGSWPPSRRRLVSCSGAGCPKEKSYIVLDISGLSVPFTVTVGLQCGSCTFRSVLSTTLKTMCVCVSGFQVVCVAWITF